VLRQKRKAQFRVWLSDEPVQALYDAQQAMLQAKSKSDVDRLQPILREAREAAAEASVLFELTALSRNAYAALVAEHPALDGYRWNPDTFPRALLKASITSPEPTDDLVDEICDDWELAEYNALVLTAENLNVTRRQVDLGKGFTTRNGG
jgi:hypothetical protein